MLLHVTQWAFILPTRQSSEAERLCPTTCGAWGSYGTDYETPSLMRGTHNLTETELAQA